MHTPTARNVEKIACQNLINAPTRDHGWFLVYLNLITILPQHDKVFGGCRLNH